jgi:hypothetical protein
VLLQLLLPVSVVDTVTGIDLRKTRIRGDNDDLIIVTNGGVEKMGVGSRVGW